MTASLITYVQWAILALAVLCILLAGSDLFRRWSGQRLLRLRQVLTLLLVAGASGSLVTGIFINATVMLVIALPLMRNILNPARDALDDADRQKLTDAMSAAQALRLLELEPEEASRAAVMAAHKRLSQLAIRPAGRSQSVYGARLDAARDYLLAQLPVIS